MIPFCFVISATRRGFSWPLVNFLMIFNLSFAARGETVSAGRSLSLPTFTLGATFVLPEAEA